MTLNLSVLENKSVEVENLVASAETALGDLLAEIGVTASFAELERTTLEVGNELLRRFLERALQTRADGVAEKVRINIHHDRAGKQPRNDCVYKRHAEGTVSYYSLCGSLRVRRSTYRAANRRNGPTVVPLELDVGLVHKATPAFAKCLALGYANGPIRSFEKAISAAFRCPPSRSTLERMAKAIGSEAKHANFFVEGTVRDEECVPRDATVVVIGLDRTSVPMEEDAPAKRRRRRSKPRTRKKPKLVEVNWRMDYVGTFSILDADQAHLVSRRYREPSSSDVHVIADRIMQDVIACLSQRPDLTVVVAQDGAPELWNSLRPKLEHEPLVKRWHEVLDWFHACERLNRCLRIIHPDDEKRRATRREWQECLLQRNSAIGEIITELRNHSAARRLAPEERDELRNNANYFEKRRELVCYASMKRRRLPLGSGITEGACKSLIGARAKRSGQRWRQRGLTAALHLRALVQSDRFDRFWWRFEKRFLASRIEPLI